MPIKAKKALKKMAPISQKLKCFSNEMLSNVPIYGVFLSAIFAQTIQVVDYFCVNENL